MADTLSATGTAWMDRAACKEVADKSIFFPVRGQDAKAAKAICAGCPVRAECLEYALGAWRSFGDCGVFGGTTPEERTELRRGSMRARSAVCGTAGGYSAHRRLRETPCEECRIAERARSRRRYRRSRAQGTIGGTK